MQLRQIFQPNSFNTLRCQQSSCFPRHRLPWSLQKLPQFPPFKPRRGLPPGGLRISENLLCIFSFSHLRTCTIGFMVNELADHFMARMPHSSNPSNGIFGSIYLYVILPKDRIVLYKWIGNILEFTLNKFLSLY